MVDHIFTDTATLGRLLSSIQTRVQRGQFHSGKRLFQKLLVQLSNARRSYDAHLEVEEKHVSQFVDLAWMFVGLDVHELCGGDDTVNVNKKHASLSVLRAFLVSLVGADRAKASLRALLKHSLRHALELCEEVTCKPPLASPRRSAACSTSPEAWASDLARSVELLPALPPLHLPLVSTCGRNIMHWAATWPDQSAFVSLCSWACGQGMQSLLAHADDQNETPLFLAARARRHLSLCALIKHTPTSVLSVCNGNGHSAASVYLLANGKAGVLRRLIRLSDPTALLPVLHSATRLGRADMVSAVLAREVPVDGVWGGRTALSRIVPNTPGALHILSLLLTAGADPNKSTQPTARSPPHLLFTCPPEFLPPLYAHGANPAVRNTHDHTPLMHACLLNDLELVAAHLAGGADPCAFSHRDGKHVVHYASTPAVLQLLVHGGADINARDRSGNTPMHNQPSVAILGLGGSGALLNCRGRSPLHMLDPPSPSPYEIPPSLDRQRLTVSTLLRGGVGVNSVDVDGSTPLHMAAFPSTFQALVECGADVNALNDDGRTPLHTAALCMPSYGAFYRALVTTAGQSPQRLRPDRYGDTLCHAIARRHRWRGGLACVADMHGVAGDGLELLPELGVSLDHRNSMLETAVHICARLGSVELLTRLLELGASPVPMDGHGHSPLFVSCEAMAAVLQSGGGEELLSRLARCVSVLLAFSQGLDVVTADALLLLLRHVTPVPSAPGQSVSDEQLLLRAAALEIAEATCAIESEEAGQRIVELSIRSLHAPVFERVLPAQPQWTPRRWLASIEQLAKWDRRPFVSAIESFCRDVRRLQWIPQRHFALSVELRIRVSAVLRCVWLLRRESHAPAELHFVAALPTELVHYICSWVASVDEDRHKNALRESAAICLLLQLT